MKENIHPDYHPVVFMDSTTGFKFCRFNKTSQETVEWEDGNTYPVIRVEVTSDSHPFYTGRQNSHTSRRTCGPFQQKIRSQRRKRCGNKNADNSTFSRLSDRDSLFLCFCQFKIF